MSLQDFILNDCAECDRELIECVATETFRLYHWKCALRLGFLDVDLMSAADAYKRINSHCECTECVYWSEITKRKRDVYFERQLDQAVEADRLHSRFGD